MAKRTQVPEFRPWVGNVAGLIGDPVKRLRFLRAVAPIGEAHQDAPRRSKRYRRVFALVLATIALLAVLFLRRVTAGGASPAAAPRTVLPAVAKARPVSDVWRVETSGRSEVYSNGLRIDNSYSTSSVPRSYRAFPVDGTNQPVPRSSPAGIVFHSTESRLAPFEAGHNEALKKIGESLLDYIRRRQSYHFLIDRFGRVYRIVAEGDVAYHAGYSVWADSGWLYLNLNESFLGIAFESQTNRDEAEAEITAAQVRSAAMLTEMLRVRYGIAPTNCVTHAQVSVNPSNMRIGYHVDWAARFPFEEVGLPDNYALAIPSVWAFGFESDAAFLSVAGGRMRTGVEAAAELLNRRAAAAGLRTPAYRKGLQRDYRRKLAEARGS